MFEYDTSAKNTNEKKFRYNNEQNRQSKWISNDVDGGNRQYRTGSARFSRDIEGTKPGILFNRDYAPPEHVNQRLSKRNIAKKISEVSSENQRVGEKLERRMEKNYNKWKEYDLLTAIIAIAGLALSVVEFEFSVWMANAIVTTETFNAGNSTVV